MTDFTYDCMTDRLSAAIDSVAKGDKGPSLVKISDRTPEILVRLGLPDLPLCFPRYKMSQCLMSGDSYSHGHKDEVGKKTLKRALEHLGDPLAVNSSEPGAFGVYLEDKASTGKSLYMYVRADEAAGCNVLLAVYGRTAFDGETFVYVDDTKVRQRWDNPTFPMQRFKTKLEAAVFKGECLTKTKLRRQM